MMQQVEITVEVYAVGMIPASLYFGDVVKLLIHWRLYYLSNKHMERFGVSESCFKRLLTQWEPELVHLFCYSVTRISLKVC